MRITPRTPVVVARRVPAPPERVFNAWVEPQMLAKWMYAPGVLPEQIARVVANPWAERTFSFIVSIGGGVEIEHAGRYLEVDPPRRLVFTWGSGAPNEDADLVTVDIAPDGAGSIVIVTHETEPRFALETADRWGLQLDALARALTAIPAAA